MTTDAPEDPDLAEMKAPRVPHTLDYVGLTAVLVPFVISFRTTSSSSMTTQVTDAQGNTQTTTSGTTKFSDPIALGGGALGVAVAIATIFFWAKTTKAKRGMRIGLTLGVLVLGVLQLVVRSGLLS